jgi:ABC-type phosphate transport system substrate-binding protein
LSIGLVITGCGKLGKSKTNLGDGQLHGVSLGDKYAMPRPPGMVYIPSGTFHMGPSDEDISYAFTARNKQISINGFWMDATEITNNEYRQFVHWVRDSIAATILNFKKQSPDGNGIIDWVKAKSIKWNDPKIIADNTDVKTKKKTAMPNLDITVYYRFDKSGTSEIFTDWLNQLFPAVWTKGKNGTFTSAFPGTAVPAGTFQSGNQSDGVANGVASKAGAIGYGEVSYATERKLVVAQLKNNSGEFVAPTSTAASIFANGYVASTTTPGVITLDYTKAIKKSYSLTGFAYGLAYTAAANKNIGTQAVVEQCMEYVVNDCATEQAAKLGYAKLSGALLALADKQIALIK